MELEHELTRRIATRIIRIKIQHCICVRDTTEKPAAGASQRGLEVYSPTRVAGKAREGSRQKKKSRQDRRDFIVLK